MFETIWSRPRMEKNSWLTRRLAVSGLKSLSCRSLIGVPILFAGLWGIYHRAEPHVSTEIFVDDCMLPFPPLSSSFAGTILLVLPGAELHH